MPEDTGIPWSGEPKTLYPSAGHRAPSFRNKNSNAQYQLPICEHVKQARHCSKYSLGINSFNPSRNSLKYWGRSYYYSLFTSEEIEAQEDF